MLIILLSLLFNIVLCGHHLHERPKLKDDQGALLVLTSDIPIGTCGGDSYFGLGIMNGTLEECSKWELTDKNDVDEYEEEKCKRLRVHGEMKNNKCICGKKWKGPFCIEFDGCPVEKPQFTNGVCTANVCQHGGSLAVGTKQIECTCIPPWDGRFCDRLACWRKTSHGHGEKRFRNNGDHCICGIHYEGEKCDIVKSCMNDGEIVDGKCLCKESYHGEICEKKCPKGQLTCSSSSLFYGIGLILSFILVR